VIREGRLLAVGSPDALRARQDSGRVDIAARGLTSEAVALLEARPEVHAVTVEDGRVSFSLRGDASVAPIVAMLVQHDVAIEEVRRARATLEDAFLDLMGLEKGANGGGL